MSQLAELHAHYQTVRARLWGPAPQPHRKRVLRWSAPVVEEFYGPFLPRPLIAILREVATAHGFTLNDLRSDARNMEVVRARHEFSYLAAVETTFSYPVIGRFIGRDHTSIIHGIRRHCDRNRLFPYPRGLPIDPNRYIGKRKPSEATAPCDAEAP